MFIILKKLANNTHVTRKQLKKRLLKIIFNIIEEFFNIQFISKNDINSPTESKVLQNLWYSCYGYDSSQIFLIWIQ